MSDAYFSPAGRPITALRLAPALQPRHMAFAHLLPHAEYVAVLLTGGRAEIGRSDTRCGIEAPAAAWLHVEPGARLALASGASGYFLGLSEQAIVEATADGIDAPLLRSFTGRSFQIDIASGEPVGELALAIEGVLRESRAASRGSRTLTAAYVRIVLVGLWRLSGVESAGEATLGQARAVLIRFRELVEVHFRDHWRIRDYADAIGVSHDRLHAVCSRELGRPPLALVHDRLNFEARQHLARAALNVQQVSHALGFRDPAHFSSFFKRHHGHAPAAFRMQARRTRQAGLADPAAGYADWP